MGEKCDRCEQPTASLVCQECGKTLRTDGQPAVLCSQCVVIIHDAIGKMAQNHVVVAMAQSTVQTEASALAEELTKATEQCEEGTLPKMDTMAEQIEATYNVAKVQIEEMMAELRTLVDERESALLDQVTQYRETKRRALQEQLQLFTGKISEAKKLVAELKIVSQSTDQHAKFEELKNLVQTLWPSLFLPFPPHSSHPSAHPGLGFFPNVRETVSQALSMCLWVSGEGVRVGNTLGVSVVGGLSTDGTFWMRLVYSDQRKRWEQELMLTYISNSLFEVSKSSTPLTDGSPGQLCAARFSQDGRWYRAVIQSNPHHGSAKFFFLDHGGSEEAPLSSLRPLPDQFRALPFQMLHCRLTEDTSISFNSREMRWTFNDCTHQKNLTAEILRFSEIDKNIPVYLVKLMDRTFEEPFDVGQIILLAATRVKEAHPQYRSRDIRYKEQRASQTTPTPAPPTTQTAAASSTDTQPQITSTMLPSPPPSSTTSPVPPPPSTVSPSPPPSSTASPAPPPSSTTSPAPPPSSTTSPSAAVSQPTPVNGLTIAKEIPTPQPPPFQPSSSQSQPPPSQSPLPPTTSHPPCSESPPPTSQPSPPTHPPPSLSPATSGAESISRVRPLQLNEAGGVLLSNEALTNDDTPFAQDMPCGDITTMYPTVQPGAQLSVVVTASLSPEGTFWCQLLLEEDTEGKPYQRLQEELQSSHTRGDTELYTPRFYSVGDVCAAIFSEDEQWYRAKVEDIQPGQFTVRYIDFGNSEEREHHHLTSLGSKFKLLPPQAVCCTIATTKHTKFTPTEQNRFDEITDEDSIIAEVLEVGDKVRVRLLLPVPEKEPVDLTEEIYMAESSSLIPSATFLPKKQKVKRTSSSDLDASSLPMHVMDWAAHMEEMEDKEDTTFLTLAGQQSRETTPSHREDTPTRREAIPSHHEDTPTRKDAMPSHREATPTRREAPPTQREGTPTRREAVTTQKEAALTQWGHRREATPTHSEATPSHGRTSIQEESRASGKREERQARLDVDRAKQNIISILSKGPHRSSPTPRHSRLDRNQRKLYVRHVPLDKKESDIHALFSTYGKVMDIDYHTKDSSKLYVVMSVTDSEAAIENLNGYEIQPGCRLLVERYRSLPSASPSPPAVSPAGSIENLSAPEGTRLFVKNIPGDLLPGYLRSVFGRFGHVKQIVPNPERRNVVYVYMDAEGAQKAINGLHGKTISKNGKPLVVELSHDRPRHR